MSDRNDSPHLPPFGVRLAIWFVLGLFMMGGGKGFERYLFPEAAADGHYLGFGLLAAVCIWVAGLGPLFGMLNDQTRHGIRMTGWSMAVAFAGFAVGVAAYLALKAQAPALLASEYGSMIPFMAAAAVTVAGMTWKLRTWSRLCDRDEMEESL